MIAPPPDVCCPRSLCLQKASRTSRPARLNNPRSQNQRIAHVCGHQREKGAEVQEQKHITGHGYVQGAPARQEAARFHALDLSARVETGHPACPLGTSLVDPVLQRHRYKLWDLPEAQISKKTPVAWPRTPLRQPQRRSCSNPESTCSISFGIASCSGITPEPYATRAQTRICEP